MNGGPRILLITPGDDALVSWLLTLGYEVRHARNDVRGVEAFGEGGWLGVLMAFEGDPLTHLTALARLRELPGGRGVPVIGMARADVPGRTRLISFAASLGVHFWLSLPASWPSFVRTLDQALGPAPAGVGATLSPPAGPAHPDESCCSDGLPAELERLNSQTIWQRLGLPGPTDRRTAREAYFARAAHFHQAAARKVSPASQTAIAEIQGLLRDAYLEARRLTQDAGQEPRKPVASPRRSQPPPESERPSTAAPAPEAYTGPAVGADDVAPATLAQVAGLASLLGYHAVSARLLRNAVVARPADTDLRYQLTMELARKLADSGNESGAQAQYRDAVGMDPGHEARDELSFLIEHHAAPRRRPGALREVLNNN